MAQKAFAVEDRVKRIDNSGPIGTVKELRVEVTASSQEAKEKGKMYVVLWDNGTLSCFGAEGLEAA
jgi:hypothetical protein